jgi:hypothetical protein
MIVENKIVLRAAKTVIEFDVIKEHVTFTLRDVLASPVNN